MNQPSDAMSGVDVLEQKEGKLVLRLNSTLYPDAIIFRAAYSFTGRCTILLDRLDSDHVIAKFSGGEATPLESLVGEFANELIGQRVRADIANETRAIRELIVAQAFAEADLGPRRLPTDEHLKTS